MDPSVGSALLIFAAAPAAIAALVILLVLGLTSPSPQTPGIRAASLDDPADDDPKPEGDDGSPDLVSDRTEQPGDDDEDVSAEAGDEQ
jgi:hypothetical protein